VPAQTQRAAFEIGETVMRALATAVRHTLSLFGSQRKLWIPFVVIASVELLLLGLVWLAPHPPFSKLLAPPIQYFFGSRVLHYPLHLWFLYHVMQHVHLVAVTLVGAFMSGVACAMVRQRHEGSPLSMREAIVSGQVRYKAVVAIWLVIWALARITMLTLGRVAPKAEWVLWAAIGATVILQALLVYAIPASVFAASKWWRALGQSVRETLRHPVSTLLIVGVPSAAVIAFSIALTPERVGQWMQRSEPEIVFAFIGGRLLLWTVADALMTIGIAHLWFSHRAQPAVRPVGATRLAQHAAQVASVCIMLTALALTGCSTSYNGERLLMKANELSVPIMKNPSTATPDQFAKAIAAFERVTQEARGTVSAAQAHLSIGSLYALQKQYDEARAAYGQTLQNYNRYKDLCLNARTAIAKTYEDEARWDEAANVFNEIADFYPWTKMGLEAPLYIGAMYAKHQQPDKAADATARAVARYKRLIPEVPNPTFGMELKAYLALGYQQLSDWDNAIAMLEELAGASSGVNRPLVLLSLGSIYQAKLGDAQKAQAAYLKLAEEFPEHPFAKIAKERLQQFTVPLAPIAPGPSATP
jgi:tetratricopeptide (TPR) repeat protein